MNRWLKRIAEYVPWVVLGALTAFEPPSRNWLGETSEDELRRRIHACETNLQNIWERLNGNTGNG